MAASAVLFFSLLDAKPSQPYSVVGETAANLPLLYACVDKLLLNTCTICITGGTLTSLVIGVICRVAITHTWIAASVSVSLTIGAMCLIDCRYPPGTYPHFCTARLYETLKRGHHVTPRSGGAVAVLLSYLDVSPRPHRWQIAVELSVSPNFAAAPHVCVYTCLDSDACTLAGITASPLPART